MCRPIPQKGQAFGPRSLQIVGHAQFYLPSHMSFPEPVPAACGGCGLCIGKPEAGSRKVDFLLLRCLHRPQAKSAEGWRRAGKRWAALSLWIPAAPPGRRKSSPRAAQASVLMRQKERGTGCQRGDRQMFLA